MRNRLFPKISICTYLLMILSLGLFSTSVWATEKTCSGEWLHVDGVALCRQHKILSVTTEGAPVKSLQWHFVIGGVGSSSEPPVVFVHGAPECWYTWHSQLAAVAQYRRVIAVDLPGFGQFGNTWLPTGTYQAEFVAAQLLRLLASLQVQQFDLVSHDWGSAIASYMAAMAPQRVHRFVRTQAQVSGYDPALTPWWDIMSQPVAGAFAVRFFQALDPQVEFPPEDIIARSDQRAYGRECAVGGRFDAWRRYFLDTDYVEMMAEMPILAAQSSMPVLLLQADEDEGQPLYLFEDATLFYPDAQLKIIGNSGHFIQIEQSQQVTDEILTFLIPPAAD